MSAAAAAAALNNDRTTFVATPVVESVDSGGQKVLHFLGIDCAFARCRRCLQSVPRNHEDALLTDEDEVEEAPGTPCSSHAEGASLAPSASMSLAVVQRERRSGRVPERPSAAERERASINALIRDRSEDKQALMNRRAASFSNKDKENF